MMTNVIYVLHQFELHIFYKIVPNSIIWYTSHPIKSNGSINIRAELSSQGQQSVASQAHGLLCCGARIPIIRPNQHYRPSITHGPLSSLMPRPVIRVLATAAAYWRVL